MEPYEIILNLRTQMQEYEPLPNNYLFQHTYDASKRVYDNCMRVVNIALCSYCVEGRHCDWFCNGNGFESKENKQ